MTGEGNQGSVGSVFNACAPHGCSQTGGEQPRFQTVLGPGGMTPQVAAYQQILNLLPAIGGPQLLSLRQVLHDAHGQVTNLPENFGDNVSQTLHGCSSIWSRSGEFHSNAELYSRTNNSSSRMATMMFLPKVKSG